tara:strand:+ start:130 stop:543 length:414 start_codon:yes stop_codon:yes gene_type:complete
LLFLSCPDLAAAPQGQAVKYMKIPLDIFRKIVYNLCITYSVGEAAVICSMPKIEETAREGLGYEDTITLLGARHTNANKKAWARGCIAFKLDVLRAQLASPDVRMLIHLGKHYLGQGHSADEGADREIRVVLDGDAA